MKKNIQNSRFENCSYVPTKIKDSSIFCGSYIYTPAGTSSAPFCVQIHPQFNKITGKKLNIFHQISCEYQMGHNLFLVVCEQQRRRPV